MQRKLACTIKPLQARIVHVGGAVQLWDGHVLLALNPWREAISAVLDSPARLQEKIPYVPLKGIEFLLKVEALRNPRAAGFDPTSVIDYSFLQELEKSGLIKALWKK